MHSSVDLIGYAAMLVAGVSTWPQTWRLVRMRTAAGVSAPTYLALLASAMLWSNYGVAASAWPQAISSAILALGALVVLGMLVRLHAVSLLWVVLAPGCAAALALLLLSMDAQGVLGWIAVVVATSVRLPQLVLLLRGRGGRGLSVTTWVLNSVAALLWCEFALLRGDVHIAVNAICSLVVGAAIVLVALRASSEALSLPTP